MSIKDGVASSVAAGIEQDPRCLRVLLVEDNPDDVVLVRSMLAKYGRVAFQIYAVDSAQACLTSLGRVSCDLVLLDHGLPDMDGLAILRILNARVGGPPVIMLAGQGDDRVAAEAMSAGAYDYLPKDSITSDMLGHAIHQAVEKFGAENELLNRELTGASRVAIALASAEAQIRSRQTDVLVVDYDPTTLRSLREMLELEGCAVTVCVSGREAMRYFENHRPSIVILDTRSPGLDGLAVCRMIRARSDVPILMLSALDDQWSAAHALESGADDYIRKPVGDAEFGARVRAVLRRSVPAPTSLTSEITIGPITLDVLQHEARVNGQVVGLSPIEFKLLTRLAMSPNHVLAHDDTLTTVWGAGYSGSRHVLRVTMSRLRQKLALISSGVAIVTVGGVGYRLVLDESAPAIAG